VLPRSALAAVKQQLSPSSSHNPGSFAHDSNYGIPLITTCDRGDFIMRIAISIVAMTALTACEQAAAPAPEPDA